MAYLLSNICTKNYWNQLLYIVEIIVGGCVVSFLRHSVNSSILLHGTLFITLLALLICMKSVELLSCIMFAVVVLVLTFNNSSVNVSHHNSIQ